MQKDDSDGKQACDAAYFVLGTTCQSTGSGHELISSSVGISQLILLIVHSLAKHAMPRPVYCGLLHRIRGSSFNSYSASRRIAAPVLYSKPQAVWKPDFCRTTATMPLERSTAPLVWIDCEVGSTTQRPPARDSNGKQEAKEKANKPTAR